ncbi:hypothetical protein Nocox_24545 [Nonomuraea coxensis DSM 45129]|uniref:Uncharacterized protein n=1 Tax=Nonomuraea coxensis DSM 45129 TaxID=1122611 RepID=A0ABX8U440_9ACTN|nr:hypothetical protein [Nonomuraea coxensis]QYC42512.1 hypothetical protein Nocox_24545 [Nonomuraea coxensis DSM 45129]
MTADQPLVCPTCQGVLVAPDNSAYTAARGRLIVSNGYCQGHRADPRQARAAETPASPAVTAPAPQRRPAQVAASSTPAP